MQTQTLRTLLLSLGFLGLAGTAGHAGRSPAPRPAAASTDAAPDADAESASSDPQTDEPQAGSDPAPAAKDSRRDCSGPRKRAWCHASDVKARLRAREEQVDRALQKLLSVKGHALQLLHGDRPRPVHRDQDRDQDGDQDEGQNDAPDDAAPARDRQAPARR